MASAQRVTRKAPRGRVIVVGRRMSTRALASALERLGANVLRIVPEQLADVVEDSRTLALVVVARLSDDILGTVRQLAARVHLPVFVAFTGRSDIETVRGLYAAGIEGVFSWPHERRGLLYAIMRVDSVVAPESLPKATNRELALRVRRRLAADPLDFGDHVHVRALDDVVFLEGEVDALWKVGRAKDAARSTSGVARVMAHRLCVGRSDIPDRQVADFVRRMLHSAARVDASTIAVSVEDGVVTLAGTVESHAEMERLTGLVEHANGVREIRNLTTVSERAKRTDSATAEGVRTAIAAECPSVNIDAAVFNGVAVLAGRVPRPSDSSAVEQIAQRQPGVNRVVNKVWTRARAQ